MFFARIYDLKANSIKDRLNVARPTMFLGVPLVWEKMADRDRYYYRAVTLFERHPEIIQTFWQEARGLMPVMFDVLSWPSQVMENGLRR